MLVSLDVGSHSYGVGVGWGLDVHLRLSAMGGANPSPVPSPGCYLVPGAGARDLAHRSVSGQGSRKQDLLGLT